MEIITQNILKVAALVYLVFAVREQTLFFQQNSYRYARYFRWLRGNLPLFSTVIYGVLAVVLFLLPSMVTDICASVVYLLGVLLFTKKKYKKPLVVTARVRRMWITCGVIFVVGSVFWTPLVWVLSVLPMVLLLVANLVNRPIEAAITQRYINEAKHIVRSMPNLVVIGVTGSYGKSSTKGALVKMLSMKYNVLATPGNFNTTLGVVRTIREQLKPYHQVFIVEMGAKQEGDIREICELVKPIIGVLTAVGYQHLETFKTIEGVQRTKFELIDALPADGLAVLCGDYEHIANREVTNVKNVAYYGVSDDKCITHKIGNVGYESLKTTFEVQSHEVLEKLSTKLLGSGNLMNITAADIVAQFLGVEQSKRAVAALQMEPVEHRLSIRSLGNRVLLDDAYNSNPVGAKMALEVLRDFDVSAYLGREFEDCKRIVVTPGLVELGSVQFEENKQLGQVIGKCATHAIVVNKVNRDAISQGIAESSFKGELKQVDSFTEAMQYANTLDLNGSVMLLLNDLPDTYK